MRRGRERRENKKSKGGEGPPHCHFMIRLLRGRRIFPYHALYHPSSLPPSGHKQTHVNKHFCHFNRSALEGPVSSQREVSNVVQRTL